MLDMYILISPVEHVYLIPPFDFATNEISSFIFIVHLNGSEEQSGIGYMN